MPKAVDLFAVFIGAGWSLGTDLAINSLSSWLMWKAAIDIVPLVIHCVRVRAEGDRAALPDRYASVSRHSMRAFATVPMCHGTKPLSQ